MNASFYKRTAVTLLSPALLLVQQETLAQKQKETKKEEIIIRKKADSDDKTTIVIDGDKVMINGEPVTELNEDNIVIKRKELREPRKVIELHGAAIPAVPPTPATPFAYSMPPVPPAAWSYAGPGENEIYFNSEPKAMLGVYTEKDEKGARITEVVKESPAEKAGLQKGDIITKINSTSVNGPSSLSEAVDELKPGDEIEIVYLRDKKERKIKVKLGEREERFSKNFHFNTPDFNEDMFRDFKFRAPFEWDAKPKLGIRIQDTEEGNGVKVLEVQEASAAEKSGIKKDDIITSINGKEIKNADEAKEKIAELKDKAAYPVKVLRNGTTVDVNIKIPKKLKTTDL
ncbi:MAG: PDZ domain-containing protein [Agriterribacter sp.]